MNIITIKTSLLASVLVATVTLTACSGSNPLDTQPRSDSLKFVSKASSLTEQSLHYTAYPPGSMYRDCMTGTAMSDPVIKKNPELCDKLFEGMAAYAKTTDGAYRNITVDDLKNDKAFRNLYQLPIDND